MADQQSDRRAVWSWVFYDWANSAFATTVMAGFFPVFFKNYWSAGADVTESTLKLGAANSAAGVIVAVLAPILGAIADRGSAKKKLLALFAVLGIVMTAGLFFVEKGHWAMAVLLYVAATVGFSGGNIFYDALIVGVAPAKKTDMVSSLGFAMGYLGGGLLFALNVAMVLKPEVFGLADEGQAVRISFIMVALWWAVFSIPILLFVKEPEVEGRAGGLAAVSAGLRQLWETLQHIRQLKVVATFLVAYWLYIDGVDTVIRMAVDYGMSLGFPSDSLIVALLIVQFVGFPAAIGFGKLGEKIGTKRGIFIAIAVYLGVTVFAYGMDSVGEFYALAITVGLVQGGVQALSRSFFARIIPADKAAEFFGFYNMLGKFAVVIGPILMGWVGAATGNPRLAILSVGVLFVLGGGLLFFVDEEAGQRAAEELTD